MSRKTRTALLAFLLVFGMTGLAFASVPLYRMFCQVTGFDGTTMRALNGRAPGAVRGRTVSIRFDANTSSALPWRFGPERHTQEVVVGERSMAFFGAKNLDDRTVTGSATFNVTPVQAAKYFTKIQCFCFNLQTLKAGEQARMPVIFYVDPEFLKDPDTKDISEITLSYTFYPVDEPKPQG
jgi:cytochrome c oxidase assembly protein subunit 11